ncbi:response regulator transcription factor [uncultured Rhodoblastus sp.]|uniref:response regulator transcription factor n=1 Tax=uncultured Rhodoblastus sp. TaxID=543037 RepID=UPI0025EC67C1|nr:response regulator transcription factor [uncultured Rhodoblastus sp.]
MSKSNQPESPPAAPEQAVYVCEDEPDLAMAIESELAGRYRVVLSETGKEAMAAASAGRALLLVMDRGLKGADGLQLVEELRGKGDRTPVLMISGMSGVNDRIAGLRAGGDDYLVKPFAMAEFSARVDALARRLSDTPRTVLIAGSLSMELIARKVRRDGREIDLLPREFKLLEYFMRRPGLLVTRKMLLNDVWNYRFQVESKFVDAHIRNLRHKLDAPGEKRLIVNLRGEGFRLDAQG